MRSENQSQSGLILIPDISGFTDFVIDTKMFVGEYITRELLSTVLESNNLSLEVSEIEGDAVLFYKYGHIPGFNNVVQQAQRMYIGFNNKLKELSERFQISINLSLKIIVHYGFFSRYQIDVFEKLYGKPIVEAHKLLKNHIAQSPPYVLFTSDYLQAVSKENFHISIYDFDDCKECKYLPQIGHIHYLKAEI